MDDKTTSRLQPSTTFDDSFSSTHSMTSYPTTSINAIISHTPNMDSKQFKMNNTLMSPPEATPMDSFSRAIASKPYQAERFPLSPPVSPATKTVTIVEDLTNVVVRDPILFENHNSTSQPLFADHENRRLVEEHIAARKGEEFRLASPPRTNDYHLALEFKSQVAQQYNANRRQWRLREMAQLRLDEAMRDPALKPRKYTTIAPANHGRPRQIKPTKPVGVRVFKPKAVKPQGDRGTTPDRRVAREDKDFGSLPDFCPPLNTLPNKANSLKVDWKGAPIDLRSDPHAHLLHPDELLLAGNLRLDCATYLTSKRRIFQRRLECVGVKDFRKTDAQQACKIDVNKASKLWQAFEKVGWLNSKLVEHHRKN